MLGFLITARYGRFFQPAYAKSYPQILLWDKMLQLFLNPTADHCSQWKLVFSLSIPYGLLLDQDKAPLFRCTCSSRITMLQQQTKGNRTTRREGLRHSTFTLAFLFRSRTFTQIHTTNCSHHNGQFFVNMEYLLVEPQCKLYNFAKMPEPLDLYESVRLLNAQSIRKVHTYFSHFEEPRSICTSHNRIVSSVVRLPTQRRHERSQHTDQGG